MKRNHPVMLLWLLLALAVLAGCGSSAPAEDAPPAGEADAPPQQETAEASPTLEELLGEDYAAYLTETITMQMENRMEKDPEVRYFPIEDGAPLTDYVAIDETTEFQVDEEGNPVILFPAGTVTDAANGDQSFRIPKLPQ